MKNLSKLSILIIMSLSASALASEFVFVQESKGIRKDMAETVKPNPENPVDPTDPVEPEPEPEPEPEIPADIWVDGTFSSSFLSGKSVLEIKYNGASLTDEQTSRSVRLASLGRDDLMGVTKRVVAEGAYFHGDISGSYTLTDKYYPVSIPFSMPVRIAVSMSSYASDSDTGQFRLFGYNSDNSYITLADTGRANWSSSGVLKTFDTTVSESFTQLRYLGQCWRVAGTKCSAWSADPTIRFNPDLPPSGANISIRVAKPK